MTTIQIDDQTAVKIQYFAEKEGMTMSEYILKLAKELELLDEIKEAKTEESIIKRVRLADFIN